MKTPKGLKKVQAKQSSKTSSLDLDKVMTFGSWWNLSEQFGSWEKMEKSPLYKGRELVDSFCSEMANDISGYSHFSDFYDEGTEYDQKEALKHTVSGYKEPSSDSMDDSSDTVDFEKYIFYEEIKEGFSHKVVSAFKNSDEILKKEKFQEFYRLCVKKKAFTGTDVEFLKALKNSSKFLEHLAWTITHYTG